ncbi:MAG TPA: TonB-dependent receptor [Novosphingobium sp.]|nr:TonB-dependent receptor [Novosphingobium sp.]
MALTTIRRAVRSPWSHCALLLATAVPVQAKEATHEEIVVTARRYAEQLHDVPLAVEVVPRTAIRSGGIADLQSLSAHLPGLSFEAAWGGFNSFPVLRGQSQPSIAGDNVGMFVDGVYQASRDALDVEPLDLDRIEVVEGPQSAHFGHSTFAGLISYVPAPPTEAPLILGSADAGTDGLYGLRGTISGPLDHLFKGRLAASWRQANGTWTNSAAPGQQLGNTRRLAIAGTLATRDGSGPLSVRLSARLGENRMSQPAFFALDFRSNNCGSRDPLAGAWSYYCGEAPLPGAITLSPRLPDSRSHTGQVALHLALDLGAVQLQSDTSLYHAQSDSIRDLDGSAEGDLYGVCVQGKSCSGVGSLTTPVARLQRVNIVLDRALSAREVAQEVRIRSTGKGFLGWEVGATLFWTRTRTALAFGGERGALAANERFAAPVLTDLQRVGAPAAINAALVNDPDLSQVPFSDSTERRRTIAAFIVADVRVRRNLGLRGELRSTWERLELDSRLANFLPSFGASLGPRYFRDITPRISLDWRPDASWLAYVSYAKGSRSGGFNAFPQLRPDEQTYAPETNWTAELGLKYAGSGVLRSAQIAAYDINWRNTQIQGLATTPGVSALIIRNTIGIHTRGFEIAAKLAPTGWLGVDLAWSRADPRFKSGSEDPGSSGFCGLTTTNASSSFCTIRPSTINPSQLVPDVSGNVLARAATSQWAIAAVVAPQTGALRGLRLRIEATHQGNVFERQIDGLYYGVRTLIGARLSVPVGRAEIEFWGTNLGDERYARVAAPRQPTFYTGLPRPVDLILADRRRIGVTVRFHS